MLMFSDKPKAGQGWIMNHRKKPVKVIAVTGGKGGIGKSNVSVNLALALGREGKKVLILDADLGLANIDIMLGLKPAKNLSHVVKGECELREIVIEGPEGVLIVPASSGVYQMTNLSLQEHAGIIQSFSELFHDIDVLIVDTAAGISESVLRFVCAAQEVLVIVCDEPTSITDAYAAIKVLSRDYHVNRFHVLTNMTDNETQGRTLFERLVKVTDRYLDVLLDYAGNIPFDEHVRQAIQKQKPVFLAYPTSKSTHAFKQLGQRVLNWPLQQAENNQVTFFFERMLQDVG